VNTPSSAVYTHNFAFSSFEVSTYDFDGITLANRDRTNGVLLSELCTEVAREKLSSDAGGSGEMSLS
jgi:hypothetical protein